MLFRVIGLLGLLLSTACATITQSPSQNVSVVTEPSGATCELRRNGAVVGIVNPTPATLRVGRSVRDLDVNCTRTGYQPAAQVVPSRTSPVFLGNILLGGVVGLIVDASTSASNYYPEEVRLTMTPDPVAQPMAPPPMTMEPIPDPMPRRTGRGRPSV